MGREHGIWLPPNYYIPMPTVISAVPTTEGIVIGSDGRKSSSDPLKILGDDTQKIFAIERRGMALAYGLFGTITFGDSTDKVIFDFESEIVRAVEKIGSRTKWSTYITALAATLEESLNATRNALNLPLEKSDGTTICIGGYYGKTQELGHIRFEHGRDQTQAEPHNYPRGFSFPWGYPQVFDLLNSGDERFARYCRPPRNGIMTLADGIDRVRNDILAHYDPEALKLDETIRWRVGGRIQIATVTLSNGFRWVEGYEPLSTGSTER